ncbi:MAG: hypothetical protein KatS3mg104_2978 [Phycisphaerae bacterium]|nr:MAG: hypothetical protein KatS3mg104_2978 [Phycisphaerae bacterium]
MVTANDLINVLTEDEKNLLADHAGSPDTGVIQSAVDRAIQYVLSYARTQDASLTEAALPDIFDDAVLTVAKYNLFTRRNLISEALVDSMKRAERFLTDVASGKISFAAGEPAPEVLSGFADRSNLSYDKLFKL